MLDRFVNIFPQNTGLNYLGHGYYSLQSENKKISEFLENESKGNAQTKRLFIKERSKTRLKQNALHLVPFIYHYQYSEEKTILASHLKDGAIFPTEHVKNSWDHICEQTTAIYKTLLEPFKGAPEDFYYLLIAQREDNCRTPFHVVICSYPGSIEILLSTIGAEEYGLNPKQKEKIALAKDIWGHTALFWIIGNRGKNYLSEIIRAFGNDIFITVLITSNASHDTPLHALLKKSITTRHEKLKIIRESLLPEEKEEKRDEKFIHQMNTMFQPGLNKLNPIHLLCQTPGDEKSDVQSIEELFQILGPEIFTQKFLEKDIYGKTALDYAQNTSPIRLLFLRTILKYLLPKDSFKHNALILACKFPVADTEEECVFFKKLVRLYGDLYAEKVLLRDEKGYTSLHYAAEKGNTRLFESILEPLTPEQKIALLSTKPVGESILALACRYGDRKMLELIAKGLGPERFYLERKRLNTFTKQNEKLPNPNYIYCLIQFNKNLTRAEYDGVCADYNSLFELLEYHFSKSTFHRSRNHRRDDTKILKRRADTIQRLKALQEEKPQPDPADEFKINSWFPFFSRQVYYDRSKKMVESFREDPDRMQAEFKACCHFFTKLEDDSEALKILGLKPFEAQFIKIILIEPVSPTASLENSLSHSVLPVGGAILSIMPTGPSLDFSDPFLLAKLNVRSLYVPLSFGVSASEPLVAGGIKWETVDRERKIFRDPLPTSTTYMLDRLDARTLRSEISTAPPKSVRTAVPTSLDPRLNRLLSFCPPVPERKTVAPITEEKTEEAERSLKRAMVIN